MIKLTADQERAFDRVIKAHAFDELLSIFQREEARLAKAYDVAKESVVVANADRGVALQLRGGLTAMREVIEMFQRQKV